ncbi:MAG: ABC transporter ATP-binding protein [Deltaproteobacteria bacterium CG11_big_fil_rev_8_21_14_0_20_49_13]|nr:MAG: ABC transporter ATP-binding protein [Deltaproteobacteria bacterium CG11_big_fil_rev_8_21_14_0_20_49_13]
MAAIISCAQLKKAFAARPLFEGINFAIEAGERIGLIGPNGAGKSTLLKIMAGMETPDEGTVSLQRGIRVGMLEQVPSFAKGATVESAITDGVTGAHDFEHVSRVREYMSKLSLDEGNGISGNTPIESLSGGWKKRVALARLFVGDHDMVLLDEPTNHLDVESILWLEDFLSGASFASVTVTHDRLFLQRVSNRIWDLDKRNPGGLLSIKGDYADCIESKALLMAGQEQRELVLKNTLRRETEWLRHGAQARTTKQYARVKQAEVLRQEVGELEYRNTTWTARLDFHSAERNPKKLIRAKGISKSYGDRLIFKDVDLLITPGLKVGLLGANGCGKTTLIRILLGGERPDTGSVETAEQLRVIYFEQNRETLDQNATVEQTVCPSGDHVKYRGNFIHIRSYLDRFNFSQLQTGMEVRRLSGGEQSRLLIAKLMLQEGNVLVLDEPTNDLDMGTLEVLEQCLLEFPGAVILVTHDRYFLDQVVNRLLAFGEPTGPNAGKVSPFATLEQWERAYKKERTAMRATISGARKRQENAPRTIAKRKSSFKEQFELDHIEENIHKAEAELERLKAECLLPDVASSATRLAELMPEMARLETEVERLFNRWAELEKIQTT